MSRSFSHTVKGNKGSSRPSHVLFADVESKLSNGADNTVIFTPFLWTCIYKRYRSDGKPDQMDTYHGIEPVGFWNMVEAHTWNKKCTYLATHHLEVDFMPLNGFTELSSRGWILDRFIANGRTLILKYRKDHRRLIVMNNGNLFESSIEQWGRILGIPKLQMPSNDAPLEAWLKYCERDTQVVAAMWDALIEFLDAHDLGNFKLTRASLALSGLKHRFMLQQISIHDDPKTLVLERRAYKGGRFEALRFGDFTDGPYYDLDVSSMYGFIESWAPLPFELRGHCLYPSWDEFKLRLNRYCVVATVDVDTSEPFIPREIDGKMKYQAGAFRCTLCTPELKYALKRGWLKQIVRMSWYYKAQVLREFARYFMQLKAKYEREHNEPMRALAKIYPNAVYGKFAQRGFKDRVIGECDPTIFEIAEMYDADTGKRHTLYKYGGKVHLVGLGLKSRDSFIALAAHITAHARLYLWQLMKLAGVENVYHVATDSLTVNKAGYERLSRIIHPQKPGTLKLKGVFTQYSVRGINDVVQDGQAKIKGITKNAIVVDNNTYTITEWPKITTLIKAGQLSGYFTRYRTKVLARPEYYAALGVANPSITPKRVRQKLSDLLTDTEQQRLYECDMQISALRASRRVPHRIVFRLWDYRKGTFKQVHDAYGNLVPFEYTGLWGNLRKLGFDDDREFQQAVLMQLSTDQQVRELQGTSNAIWYNVHCRASRGEIRSDLPSLALEVEPEPIGATIDLPLLSPIVQ